MTERERCGSVASGFRCEKPIGHEGGHEAADIGWADVEPTREVPEQIPAGPVCEHCGFAPVTHEQWQRVVMHNLGENARAAVEEIAAGAMRVGEAAGERGERARLAYMLVGLLNAHGLSEIGTEELVGTLRKIADNLGTPRGDAEVAQLAEESGLVVERQRIAEQLRTLGRYVTGDGLARIDLDAVADAIAAGRNLVRSRG